MILRHLAVCFGVEIDGINIDILKVLVWGAASPVSIGIYCDCFGSVSIGSIYGIFWSVLSFSFQKLQANCASAHARHDRKSTHRPCLAAAPTPEALQATMHAARHTQFL